METTRTYEDILKLQHALSWLGNQKPGEKAKPSQYNALNLRIHLTTQAYRPLFDAIDASQKAIHNRYAELAGDDMKNLDNGNLTFGVKLDREYQKEIEELLDRPVEDEPKRRTFKLADFDIVGISVPQAIMSEMGPMLEGPAVEDPDAIEEEEEATV